MSINRVIISGNLTRDPELRQTTNGMPVLSMGMAVNDRVKNNQTGQWEDRPNFVDLTMFGSRAQSLSQYLAKGSKVAIEGRLRYSSWQDKQTGQKRSKLEVVVDNLDFMSGRSQGNQGQTYNQQSYQQPQYSNPQPNVAQAVQAGFPGAQVTEYPANPVPAPQSVVNQANAAFGNQQPQDAGVYDDDIPF